MKVILIFITILPFFYTACSTKPQPKLCKVVIDEPSKAELEKFKRDNIGKKEN